MSATHQELLTEAQELLDQRLDPLDQEGFAERLASCPEALDEVIALRALALSLQSFSAQEVRSPILAAKRWWLAPLAAAAALLLMLLPPVRELAIIEEPMFTAAAEPSAVAIATPAVLHWEQTMRSTTLSPPPSGDVLSLSITSSRSVRP